MVPSGFTDFTTSTYQMKGCSNKTMVSLADIKYCWVDFHILTFPDLDKLPLISWSSLTLYGFRLRIDSQLQRWALIIFQTSFKCKVNF